ncbi:MAG: DNA-directed DNA polymerase I [Candidatus Thorarchaeota archaeon]
MAKDKESEDKNQSTLDDFFDTDEAEDVSPNKERSEGISSKSMKDSSLEPKKGTEEDELPTSSNKESDNIVDENPQLQSKTEIKSGYRDTPENLPASYLLSVDYEGRRKKAVLQLYNPQTKKTHFWYDNTAHQPYCYTDLAPKIVEDRVKKGGFKGHFRTEEVQLKDLLRDESRSMTKVIADDPLSIGGRDDSIREHLIEHVNTGDPAEPVKKVSHAWEAAIRYRNCYSYDRDLVPGLLYSIDKGDLIPSPPDLDTNVLQDFKKIIQDDAGLDRIIDEYAPMFFSEVPDIRRIAIDIEVYTPTKNRIPDANTASEMVTAIGLSDNEDLNICFLLERSGVKKGTKGKDYPSDLKMEYFKDEKQMIIEAFRIIDTYPIVLTFVGDAFDLNYLYNRAEKLGVNMNIECPLRKGRDVFLMKRGVHVDLYRFLKNPSVRLYALSGAYERSNLESIAQGLLGIGKLDLSTDISSLPYLELAHYCWLDANITLQITQYQENLLLRLIILLMRISRLSMEDVTRFGISQWIQSLFRQEHRSNDILIPQQREIKELKSGEAQTEAMIKDKAFKGAIVIEPVAGVHFNATVLDFASLYPTIMKTHNISYETVDCPHDVCKNAKDNRVPETEHWTCTINRGMISETIGFFRDTRVKWFKDKSKDNKIDDQTRNWYAVVEKALKVFVNASYGVTGAQHFELFCMPAAESVTAYGRDAIIRTKEKAESMGVRVLYGDTDSVFLDNPSEDQQKELVEWSSKDLGIDLEVEKTYKYVALSARKKNYIGVYESGYVEVKGLSGKKRNTPKLVQDAFNQMLEILAKVDNIEGFETAKEEIREIVNIVIDRLEGKSEPFTPEDLAFRIQMTKSLNDYGKTKPQHVRAAQMMHDAGFTVGAGTLVEYIKTKDNDGVLPVPMAADKSYWIDKDKYVDTLKSVFEQVLDSVGLDFEELLGFTTLDQFF